MSVQLTERIEALLKEAQRTKTFKDVGRVGGTAKERAAYSRIGLDNLPNAEAELDETSLGKLVNKGRVLPKFSADADKANGVTPGASLFRYMVMRAWPASPDKQGARYREAYVTSLTTFNEITSKDIDIDSAREAITQVLNTGADASLPWTQWAAAQWPGGTFTGRDMQRATFSYKGLRTLERFLSKYSPAAQDGRQADVKGWGWTDKYFGKTGATGEKAEKHNFYLAHLRRENCLKVPDSMAPGEAKEKWLLRAIQYGNSLPDEDSRRLTVWMNRALTDMQDLVRLDIAAINQLGGLGIDFATRGIPGSAATYWPSYTVINLNRRNGDGSLGHEWGHYLDNTIGRNAGATRTNENVNGEDGMFASGMRTNPESSTPADRTVNALLEIIKLAKNKPRTVAHKFLRNKMKSDELAKLKGATLDATIAAATKQYRGMLQYSQLSGSKWMWGVIANMHDVEDITVELHHNGLDFVRTCSDPARLAIFGKSDVKYWTSNAEVFARAWEGYLLGKAEQRGMRIDFLVNPEKANIDLWPSAEDRSELLPLFDTLVASLRAWKPQLALPLLYSIFLGERQSATYGNELEAAGKLTKGRKPSTPKPATSPPPVAPVKPSEPEPTYTFDAKGMGWLFT